MSVNENTVLQLPSPDNAGDSATAQTKPGAGAFDVSSLRLSQDFASNVGVKKALLTIPVRKPDRQWFVRVHPDPAYRFQTAVLELKEDREVYLVAAPLWAELPGEIVPMELFTAINRQGVLFIWPVRLPAEDGRQLEWHRSAAEAAEMAIKTWVKVQANMGLGAYEVFEATGNLPEPEWPGRSLDQLLRIAFKDRFIDGFDHPVLRRLRGEV